MESLYCIHVGERRKSESRREFLKISNDIRLTHFRVTPHALLDCIDSLLVIHTIAQSKLNATKRK